MRSLCFLKGKYVTVEMLAFVEIIFLLNCLFGLVGGGGRKQGKGDGREKLKGDSDAEIWQ